MQKQVGPGGAALNLRSAAPAGAYLFLHRLSLLLYGSVNS